MRRAIGVALIIAAVFGLILSLGGLVATWAVKDRLATNIKDSINLLSSTVEATGSALVVADKALESAVGSISALENTVQTLGVTVNDTTPLLDSISKVMTVDLPGTLQAAQGALTSAKSSAQSIESTLRLLTSIPLLPIDPYKPAVPLTESLGNLSESLNPLTETFSSMDKTLASSKGNLIMLGAQVSIVSRRVGEIKTSLSEAQRVISNYQTMTATLTGQLEAIQQNIDTWINSLAWLLTIIFIWLAFTQIGLLMQGWQLLVSERMVKRELVEPDHTETVVMDTPREDLGPP